MTLKELQLKIADALNADEMLSQGGCRAFAEDTQNVMQDVAAQLQEAGGVALVVNTPDADRAGGSPGRSIMLDVGRLAVAAVERPAINRLGDGHMTALQAAQRAALLLDSPGFEFQGLSQAEDEESGTVMAEAFFSTQVELTNEGE